MRRRRAARSVAPRLGRQATAPRPMPPPRPAPRVAAAHRRRARARRRLGRRMAKGACRAGRRPNGALWSQRRVAGRAPSAACWAGGRRGGTCADFVARPLEHRVGEYRSSRACAPGNARLKAVQALSGRAGRWCRCLSLATKLPWARIAAAMRLLAANSAAAQGNNAMDWRIPLPPLPVVPHAAAAQAGWQRGKSRAVRPMLHAGGR